MSSDKLGKLWLAVTFLLIAVIIVSSLMILKNRSPGQAVSISSPQPPLFSGQISIEGAVNKPGIYPSKSGDTLDDLLQASGGTTAAADLSRLSIRVPQFQADLEPQKVDINRADAWLLEALPDIGATRAEAIIQYRLQKGRFHSLDQLTEVPGISQAIFDKIKSLITFSG